MKNFNDLGFGDEPVAVDFDNLPEQFTVRDPLPQPGAGYEFRLPLITLNDDRWDTVNRGDGGKRLSYSFREGKSLVISKSPRDPKEVGYNVPWWVSNNEQEWNEGEGASSDLAYLLAAVLGPDEVAKLSNAPNIVYAKALCSASTKEFAARVVWNANCNEKNDIYRVKVDEAGNVVESGTVAGKKGCGRKYAQAARVNKKTGKQTLLLPKDPDTGLWAQTFDCPCGGRIWVNVNLREFKPSSSVGGVEAPAAEEAAQ